MRDRPGSAGCPPLMRAIYRAILLLYPRRVRQRLADDQLRLFAELWALECPRGFFSAASWTFRTCLQAALAAVALHRDQRGHRPRNWRLTSRRPTMDLVRVDLVQAWRAIVRRPAATLGLVAVIGLGVGLTSAMFALADPYVLRPLPYADPDRLVAVNVASGATSTLTRATALPTFDQWRARSDLFSGLAAWTVDFNVRVRTTDGARALTIGGVTASMLEVLGVAPRQLGPLVDAGRGHDTALALTARGGRLLGDAGGRGRMLELGDGRQVPIVATVPPALLFPGDPRLGDLDAWTILEAGPVVEIERWQDSGRPAVSNTLRMVGRLAPGVTAEAARAALAFPREDGQQIAVDVRPLADVLIGDARRSLALGALAAAIAVLFACAGNSANLLIAGALHRTRERATRAALGASRVALFRLTAIEAALAAGIAWLAGLAICAAALAILRIVIPLEYATLGEPSLTGRTMAFALFATMATLAVASVPAAIVRRFQSRSGALRDAEPGARGVRVMRFVITAAQSALVIVLAIGAALLVRSQVALLTQRTGFSNLAFAATVRYPDLLSGPALEAQIQADADRLRRLRGTDGVAVVQGAMLNDTRRGTVVSVSGKGAAVAVKSVTPEFFDVAGLALLQGRGLQPADTRRQGIVVNQAFARHYWPDGAALGRTVQFGRMPAAVVGVVEDGFDVALDVAPTPAVFTLFEAPASASGISFVIRSGPYDFSGEGMILAALTSSNRDLVVRDISRIGERLMMSVRDRIFAALVLLFFAVAAIAVSVAGIIGIVTFIVGRRTREIAIRLAIGARASQVRRLVLLETLIAVAAGAVAGLVAGQWMSKSLESLLYRVEPGDWLTATMATLLTVVIMTLAASVPASRAARLPPSIALRVD